MWLFPYEHFYIRTHLSRDEIIKKLQEITYPPEKTTWFTNASSWSIRNLPKKHYYGAVTPKWFSIRDWEGPFDVSLEGVASATLLTLFMPVVDGEFLRAKASNEEIIKIRLRLQLWAAVVMIVWLIFGLFLGIGIFDALADFLKTGVSHNYTATMLRCLLPIFLFGYGMMILDFQVGARRNKHVLRELTDAFDVIGTL